MKPLTDQDDGNRSSIPCEESQQARMKKPPIHTTKYGTQSVDVIDVIQSETGWAEIQRLKDANLVHPSRENGTNSSVPSNEKLE
jgi:hypothetical protein